MKQIQLKFLLLFLSFFVKTIVFTQVPDWEWVKIINVDTDGSSCSATDLYGNVYYAARFSSSTLTVGGITVTNTSAGTSDIIIVKYDVNGSVQWVRSAGGSNIDYPTSITTDPSGNVIVTGPFLSPIIDFGGTNLSNSGGPDDFFLVKYDAAGNVSWARSAIGSGKEGGRAVTADAAGNIYVAGHFFSSTITFGSISLSNTGNADMFVVKYDTAGNALWARSTSGSSEEEPYSIAVDLNGNVFVTGYFLSQIATFGGIILTRSGSYGDMFLVKYDNSGNVLWAKNSLGNHFICGGDGVATDALGNVIVSGYFDGSVSFGNGALTSLGERDVYIVKYDASGNMLWCKREGGAGDDMQVDNSLLITIDDCSHIYITGHFSSSPILFGSSSYTSAGGYDIFVLKYDPLGNLSWTKQVKGTGSDIAFSINFHNGSIYLSGVVNSSAGSFDSMEVSGGPFIAKLLNYSVDAGNDAIVYFGSPAVQSLNCKTLNAVSFNNAIDGTFNWTSIPLSIIANNTNPQVTVCPQVNTNYIITYTTLTNCVVTDTILVKAIDVSCGNNNNKVKVCITTPSGQQTTICVAQSAITSVLTNNPNALLGDCSAYNSRPGSIVQDEVKPDGIKIYPNPSSGVVYVSSNLNESLIVRIFDVQGKLIQRKQLMSGNNSAKLDLSNLNKGLYIIEITQNNYKQISKIVIQ